ncbi:hypothetical protein [Cupriavidus lacunae]|nr:hypothetical protein [Cupriavidus lacunae]
MSTNSTAQTDVLALSPGVASSLSKFGLSVFVGAAQLVSDGAKTNVNPEDAEVLGRDLTGLVDRYRDTVSAARVTSSLISSNGEVVITAAQTLATGSGVGALPAAAAASFARYGNEQFANWIADEGIGKARGVLSAGLQSMTKWDRNKFDALISDGKYPEAGQLFEKRTRRLSTLEQALKDDPQAAAAARQLVLATMQQTNSAALIVSGKSYAEVQRVEGALATHVKTATAFNKAVKDKLEVLETRSAQLNAQLQDVQNDVQALRQDQQATGQQVALIQDILFEQQPPAVKLALLEGGAKPGLTGAQREKAVNYLKTEVKKQEIIATASSVVTAARDVTTIMSNFGMKVDPKVSQAIEYGTVATDALGQAFSGNYLGAISTVSGLFGRRGGSDPYRAQFAKIFAELAVIQEKLDRILELQTKTLEAIDQLSVQLAQTETRLHQRLDNIEFEVKSLTENTRTALFADYQPCMTAWRYRDAGATGGSNGYAFDRETLSFRSPGQMLSYTAQWGVNAAFPCAIALRGMVSQFTSGTDLGNPLRLELAASKLPETPSEDPKVTFASPDLARYLKDVHEPAFLLVRSGWEIRAQQYPGWGSFAGAFAMLSSPAATGPELLARVRKLDGRGASGRLTACGSSSLLAARAKTLLCSDGATFDPVAHGSNEEQALSRTQRFLGDAILREQVGAIVEWSALVSAPANFAPGGGVGIPLTLQQLADQTAGLPVAYGKDLLFGALTVSDVAVAQQAMVYGDLTAYFVYDALWDVTAKRFRPAVTSQQKRADDLLRNANNPWLRQNVATLILMATQKCAATPCGANELGYRAVLAPFAELETKSDGSALAPISELRLSRSREILLGQFQLPNETQVFAADGPLGSSRTVSFRLGGYDLPLPTLADWSARRMTYPVGTMARVRDREVLAERYADYSVFTAMDKSQAIRVVRILANGE